MTLLNWLEQTPNAHLLGECFVVQQDLVDATERLAERTHLLPMSDATLLQVATGMAIDGACPVVEWPSNDLSSIAQWTQKLPQTGIGALVIRIHLQTTPDTSLFTHPMVEVWSVLNDEMRTGALQRAVSTRKVIILLESTVASAWHKLENSSPNSLVSCSNNGALDTAHCHCVLVSSNIDAEIVQATMDALDNDGIRVHWIQQHNLTALDSTALQAIFDVGRVVCVGLPSKWLGALMDKAFWRLESQPLFCDATIPAVQQSVYTVLEQ